MNQLHVFLLSMIISIGGVVSQLEGGEFALRKGNEGNAFLYLPNEGFYLYIPVTKRGNSLNLKKGDYLYHVEEIVCKVVVHQGKNTVTLYKEAGDDQPGIILSLSPGEIDESSIKYLEPVNGVAFWNIKKQKKTIPIEFISDSEIPKPIIKKGGDKNSGDSSVNSEVIHISATQPTEDDFLPPLDGRKSRYSHFTKTTPSYTFSDALVFFMVHAISKEIALHWLSHSGCSIKPIKYRSLHLINNQIAIAAAEGALWGGISVGSNSSSLTSSKVGDVILSALGNGAIALVQEWIRQPIEWYARKWCNNISLKTNQSSGGHYIAALLAKELLRQTIRSGLHIAVMMMVYGIHSYQCKIKMAHMGPWWDDKNVGINCAYYFFKKLGMVS